jgi:hypothetical protein
LAAFYGTAQAVPFQGNVLQMFFAYAIALGAVSELHRAILHLIY